MLKIHALKEAYIMIEQFSSSQSVRVKKMPLVLCGFGVGFISRLLPQNPFPDGSINVANLVASLSWGIVVAIVFGILFVIWDTFLGNDSSRDLDPGDVITPFVPGLLLGSIVAMIFNP